MSSKWSPVVGSSSRNSVGLPAELPAGPLPLYAGMYDLLTLDRLPVASDSDNWVRLGDFTAPSP